MVRTRANPAAVRKAVAAKAPRKSLAARTSVTSPSSSSKKKTNGGGNSIKLWPKPSWQKGLTAFMGLEGGESSSSSSSTNTSLTENDLLPEEEHSECAGSSSSGMDTERAGSSSLQLLGGDIAQLNSDSEED